MIQNQGVIDNQIEELKIPEGTEKIEVSRFKDYSNIKRVILPVSIKIIDKLAFQGCEKLEDINIPDGITEIGNTAFGDCKSLKKISLPSSVLFLGSEAFINCDQLQEIVLSDKLGNINYKTFENCIGLKSVMIPKGIKRIDANSFYGCLNLEEIVFNEGLKRIENSAFEKCNKLQKLSLPAGLIKVGNSAFAENNSLKSIVFPDSIEIIGYTAFRNCENLESVYIPDNGVEIDNKAFLGCNNLCVYLVNNDEKLKINCKYFGTYINFDYPRFDLLSKISDKLENYQFRYPIIDLVIKDIRNGVRKVIEEFEFNNFKSHNPNIQDMLKEYPLEEERDFYKFATVLGCFSPEKIKDKFGNETETSYSQKASALVATLLNNKQLEIGMFHNLFSTLKISSKVNSDFLDFITPKGKKKDNKNLELLLSLNRNYPGIFEKVMTDFPKAKGYRKTLDDNGMVQTVPWEEALKKFYFSSDYKDIEPENEDMAQVYGSKGLKQKVLDEGIRLRKSAIDQNVPEHLLNEPLKEKSILEMIEELKSKSGEILADSKTLIEDLFKRNFTYEWLSKYDPHNGIMGLFTDCCGTINSDFYGAEIAEASIVSKDVQNIIVRDYTGKIVSKGSMYLNRESGYAVINDFELDSFYKKHEKESGIYDVKIDSKDEENRQMIFDTFMRGLLAFVQKYDEQHPDNKIKQINVGMGFNRLKRQVQMFEKASCNLSVPAQYGFKDALETQHILYDSAKKEALIKQYCLQMSIEDKNTDDERI